jgi:hypothetical protein
MLVHNLSDVETPKLKQFGLCNMGIAVDGVVLMPGTSVEAADTAEVRAHLEHLCSVGAACIGDPPSEYTTAKGGKPALVFVEPPKAPEAEASSKKKRE